MELKKYKLGDVATIIVGYPFESERFNTEGKGILLVRGMNVSERFLRFGEEARWWDEITDKYLPYYLQENDVLIGMDGSKVGKNFAIVKKEDLPLLLVQRVACIRAKSGFDQHFIWQYVSSPRFIEYVNTIKTGSSIPHISGSQIANFPIFAPSFEIQTRIGSLLSNLDRKIALNRAINRNLEAFAKQLYDYWFVQFDFPDENGRPYKSSGGKMVWNEVLKREIPVEWEVKSVNDVSSICRGVSYKPNDLQESGVLILRGNNIENNHIVYDNNTAYLLPSLISDEQKIKKHDIIITMSSGSKEHIGKCAMFQRDSEHSFGAFLSKITPDKKCPYFLFLYLTSQYFKQKIKSICNGTGINNLTNQTFDEVLFAFPEQRVLTEFEKVAQPIFDTIGINENEITVLTRQRDELLPLLMNGQVEVGE